MRFNPYLNAIYAAAYIWAIALLFQYINSAFGNRPDTLVDPILALSLFVFSAALMAFLFFYHPGMLLLDGKRDQAAKYFLKTLATFGVLTVLVFALLSVL